VTSTDINGYKRLLTGKRIGCRVTLKVYSAPNLLIAAIKVLISQLQLLLTNITFRGPRPGTKKTIVTKTAYALYLQVYYTVAITDCPARG
jgi:hypothetical protein